MSNATLQIGGLHTLKHAEHPILISYCTLLYLLFLSGTPPPRRSGCCSKSGNTANAYLCTIRKVPKV